jgi:multiple sugar transport system substrate-binding protein
MNPLIKQNKFDLNRIEPAILEEMKSYSDKGELFGLPYTANFTALFYNKDLFDKFGVAYPKDGMMWSEVVDLAKKMTRNVDGVQYRGLDPENITRISSPLGVTYVDKQTNKPTIQSWKPGYDLLQSIINIPGNAPTGTIKKFDGDPFFKDKVVAMTATTNAIADFKDNTMDWDMVTYPQYPDHKGTFGVAGARPLMISSASKYKQQAFQVIDTVLSNEVQMKMNRLGTVSPLTDKAVQDAFGADIPYVKGKNLAAIYKLKPGWRKLSNYDDIAAEIVFRHSVDMYSGKDINTVIRETEDEITKAIAEEKAKGGK